MQQVFFTDWNSLLRTLLIGVMAYLALIVFLRFSGNRTLSKMNAFDLIVTVALGSTLATVLLTKAVALADGLLAFILLITLQYIITWSSLRSSSLRHLITGKPRMLLYQGQILSDALREARVTEEEIRATVRAHGFASWDRLEAIVLETDGSFSVVKAPEDHQDTSALKDVRMPGHLPSPPSNPPSPTSGGDHARGEKASPKPTSI